MEPKSINFTSVINSSFEAFLTQNQITYPNLKRELLDKWDFLQYLQNKESLTFSLDQIKAIPPIDIQSLSSKPSLVKFCGIIQNVLENQLYLCAQYNQTKKAYEVNKYYEAPIFHNNGKDDEDLGCIDQSDDSSAILCDRLVLNIIPIPGLIKGFREEFAYESLKDKKIFVYDYTNSFSKVNQELLTIGVAYMKEKDIVIHSWKSISNYIPYRVTQSISLKSDEIIRIRNRLITRLTKKCLFNDSLSAEYVLMFLLSQVFSKYGSKSLGIFPINIILSDQTKGVISELSTLIKSICLFTTEINITIDSLNKTSFYPRFDPEKDELFAGVLQQNNKSFLILNEYDMNEGKLDQIGIKNVNSIKNLIDFQSLLYEYPYNAIEIPHDCEIIAFTNKQKSLFISPFMTMIPLTTVPSSGSEDQQSNTDTQDDIAFFNYINYLRYSETYTANFIIEDDLSAKIQADYISKYKDFNPDDFDRCLKLCRLYSISKGESKLTYSDYLFILDLESNRLKRLELLFAKTK